MNFNTLRVNIDTGKAIIMLNREKQLNVINREMLMELQIAADHLEADDRVRAIIIGGEGPKAFSSGGDIREEMAMSAEESRQWSIQGHKLMETIEESKKPYIAAVHGYTYGGGCELAIACDFRIAADDTLIAAPSVKLGMMSGFGANIRLPKLIGLTKAKEMLMLGTPINAEEGRLLGLYNKVVPGSELMAAAVSFADELLRLSPAALTLVKKAINYSLYVPTKEAISNEIDLFEEAGRLEDKKEGMSAFLEKRKPRFTGK